MSLTVAEDRTQALGAEAEAEYFDALAASEGEFNPFSQEAWDTLRRRFVEFASPAKRGRTLDVGCGTGQSRQLYSEYTSEYIGVDLAEHGLDIARRRFPQDTWTRADARRLPFEDAAFDIVAFSSVLHHIPDFELALAEGYRVLRPGGVAFAFDPNVLHPAMALFRCPKSPLYSSRGVSPNEAPLRPRRLHRAFGRVGFVTIRQRAQSGLAYRKVAPPLLNACLGAYNVADGLFERSGLGRWFGTFVITCGRRPE